MHWSLFLILKIFGGALIVGAIYFWIARYEAMRPVSHSGAGVSPRSDQRPAILLGGQTTAYGRQLLLGEGYAAALLALDLDEAWFGADSNFAGKLEAQST